MINLNARHPDYVKNVRTWEYLKDVYIGIESWTTLTNQGLMPNEKTQLFLPKNDGESQKSWLARINQTDWNALYAQGLRRFVDLTFYGDITLDGNQQSPFYLNKDNITKDNLGYLSYFRNLALHVLVCGHSYVLIDNNLTEKSSLKDLKERPPYFVTIEPTNLVNWGYDKFNNFEFAIIYSDQKMMSSTLEYYNIPTYYYFTKGSIAIYQNLDDDKFSLVRTIQTGLDFVPIVKIKSVYNDNGGFIFKSVADKNRILYQKQSYHGRKIALCCNPVPVLKDLNRNVDDELIIGPSNYINIQDPNGSFSWQEPLALSLRESAKEINDLTSALLSDIAQFLIQPLDRQSALASKIQTNQYESNLKSFTSSFVDGLNNLIQMYNIYNKTNDINIISISSNVFNVSLVSETPILPYYQAGVITADEARKLLELQLDINLDDL
jgi:hypothetical protein